MSSSYIVEPQESSEKKDDTLIIVVNDDGTISVDEETLENMIINQSTANVSVVRVGQSDAENGDLTLTVDPPSFTHPTVSSVNTHVSTDPGGLVDPFLEMDQEQLERLETALHSEEAKHILGENVTAMLDMLSIEEQQNTMRYNIQLDHCYTSRLSPSDPVPRDPLPITDDSPESNDVQYVHQSIPLRTTVSTSSVDADTTGIKNKNILKNIPLQSKQMNRSIRKASIPTNITGLPRANTSIAGTPKLSGKPIPRNINVQQGIQQGKAQGKNNEEEKDYEGTESSTTSSESEPPSDNDNDSDFGPRSVKRGNVRSRGGGSRKGITTRGGSMVAAVRRRGQNFKHLDVEQVRRLDMEMAAAVNAMKSGEKEDRSERFNLTKSRRQIKTIGGKKKEEFPETSSSVSEETPTTFEKPLQTTNQVKANLINANMIKGDMILTKPGQGRNNQKVTFVQKQVSMKPGEFKLGLEKSAAVPRGKIQVTSQKFFATRLKDGKLVQVPMIPKSTSSNVQGLPVKTVISQQAANQGLSLQQQSKTVLSTSSSPLKIKISDIKKEKRKADALEPISKIEESPTKSTENKALDSAKRPKKDNRKIPGYVTDSLGPALFSTPDIIRRVGSNSDNGKTVENTTQLQTTSISALSSTIPISTVASLNLDTLDSSHATQSASNFNNKKSASDTSIQSVQPEPQLNFHGNNNVESEHEQKSEQTKTHLSEELQPSLDTGGLEGEEQLFATLEMEANKHEEELLAEALLLQEELGVDLAEHSALVDPTPTLSEPLASSSMLIPTLMSTEQESPKSTESSVTQAQTNKEISKKSSKDDKEPIQIIRGNRVITLPPIEAPATRSKRLQAKTEALQKNSELVKKSEKFTPQTPQLSHNREELRTGANEEEDDDEEDEEENSDSEDDPDRLWCICKRPHNNRFMICCDVCEDWFHGKCVHVSKAMGQQMEEKGIEWVCPNCLKKKAEEEKTKSNLQSLSGKQKTKIEPSNENVISHIVLPSKEILSSSADHSAVPAVSSTMQCVVCKKEARNSSIYCSDACILAHAQETQALKDKPVPTGFTTKANKQPPATETVKAKAEPRVIVIDKKTNRILTGAEAPLRSNLRTWLKENPTYRVLQPQDVNTLQVAGKLVTQIQTSEKIGKITQVSPTKVQTIPKMIYTKVPGTKQTILTASSKVVPTTLQLNVQSLNKPVQLKQTVLTTTPGKMPLILPKMASPKNVTTLTHVKVQASSSPKQTPLKKPEPKPSPSQPKQTKLTPAKKTETTEPIRESVRKTLTDVLSSRIKETEDLQLTDEEIVDLACNIELEMYKYFKDTGSKYKAKYRSLIFNIKDTKNLTLFRKIADRSLTPHAVVRLNPDKMASQELAEWREKEAKHQLEIIKKNELDLMAQAKSIVVKTHKGEQIIENDGGIDHVDPKTPVQDIVNALNSGDSISSTVDDMEKEKTKEERQKSRADTKKQKNTDERRRKDKERSRERDSSKSRSKDRQERSHSRHRHSRDRDRDRDHSKTRDKSKERKSNRKESRRDKEREREKDRDRTKDRDRASRSEKEKTRKKEKDRHKSIDSHMRNRSESRESKDVDKKEEERKKEMEKKKETSPQPTEKPIEDRLWRHIEDETTTNTIDGNDSDISDREPSSTVTIKTPDINEEPERDKEVETNKETPGKTVWRGFVNMVDVAKFFITAQEISGNAKDLMDDLPDTVDVVGRISHQTVWDYISKMKKSGSKEILVIRLTAANDEEKIPYITLYSYLNSRSRLGVVGNVSKTIKDFYIMPFSSQSTLPPVLLPLTGTGFEEHRPHLLLGIIVRNKKKRLTVIPPVMSSKTAKKESDRSYTPPLIGVPKEKTSSPPPSSSSPIMYKTTMLDSTKEKPVTQMTLESLNKAYIGMSRSVIDTATICKIVPELSSKIDLTSSPSKVGLDDDGDEPYSPGEMDEDINSLQASDSAIGKNSTELQKKMEELNRQIEEQKQQIEEQKQQIQSISSSFLDDEATPTLPGLGLDPPNDSEEEAYSPTNARSFTPPPPGISKFAQPILDKVSDITIPPNLQEILANVKRQESSKVDPYLPSKPSATFLPTASTSLYQNTESYSPSSSKINQLEDSKESKSTLSTLSDLDLIRKAEEELAVVAAATAVASTTPPLPPPLPPLPPSSSSSSTPSSSLLQSPVLIDTSVPPPSQVSLPAESAKEVGTPYKMDPFKKNITPEQPKPPGLEDEDFPTFPSTIPPTTPPTLATHSKITPKSGNIVLNVKRKLNDDGRPASPTKISRTKSRWSQGPE